MGDHGFRPAWVEIDVGALRHNAAVLRRIAAPAALCAVVKADGYGHGSVAAARAALAGGATWLAVALVEEGIVLRRAGIDAPILLLSEPVPGAARELVAAHLVPTVYTDEGIDALASAAGERAPGAGPLDVHVKLDTGMHRVGAEPVDAVRLADRIAGDPGLRLQGVWTHLAVADGTSTEDVEFTGGQLAALDAALADLRAAGHDPELVHAANSAGAIAHPAARRDLVRCGIALYGESPSASLVPVLGGSAEGRELRPVLSLRAKVGFVRTLGAGERPSYGRRRALDGPTVVATIPIGYADGVPRRLFDCGGEVLIGGRRRPLAGVVTMDQIVVDCGPPETAGVAVGDDVVLIGRQGDESVTAADWADLLGTISYEVLCDIGPRVPRVVVDHAAT